MAFTGGVNLADEYINEVKRFGHWKDTAVCLRGGAARSFTLMFLQMWYLGEKAVPEEDFLQLPAGEPGDEAGFVMPYADCPLDGERVGEWVYMDLLNRARDYVYIMTPYLILDGELETALKFAAERGVDVRLLLPRMGTYGLTLRTQAYRRRCPRYHRTHLSPCTYLYWRP